LSSGEVKKRLTAVVLAMAAATELPIEGVV
jgi:hypothetical protein